MMELFRHHFNNEKLTVRKKISKVNKLISLHEEEIANPILDYISNRDDLKLIGKKKIINKDRAPTISFINKFKKSSEVSNILVLNNIATRNDNFYAWRCLKALKVDTNDGLVRLSMSHYNSIEDTERVIKALEKIN